MNLAINTYNICKTFGKLKALNDISFSIEEGELFGVIGPDGAGKTTLFRILSTVMAPDSGNAEILGSDLKSNYMDIRRKVGYMPGRFSLYQDLSVEENLKFYASVYGTSIEDNYELIKEIYEQLLPFRGRRAGALSGGMKQKLALCCSLIHSPHILFLDEPTTGVDPVSRQDFWQMLRRLKERGVTVVVSTPFMDEALRCDRIAFLYEGEIKGIDKPEIILEQFSEILCPPPLLRSDKKDDEDYIIEVDRLVKKFGDFTAVKGISFRVRKGEIFGFLGANGAGKTTAMRMLCGLSLPTAGSAKVMGYDVATQSEMIKREIGYMSQKFSLYDDLTVYENIRLFAGIYGIPGKEIKQRAESVLSSISLADEADTLVGQLPLGWKQRLAFSVAILHKPRLVFLDEPTGGVDPLSRKQFWELIYKAADSGITIFVTTHYMDEAEYCDRISMMVDGEIKALDTPANLKKTFGAANMDEVFRKLAREAIIKE